MVQVPRSWTTPVPQVVAQVLWGLLTLPRCYYLDVSESLHLAHKA